MTDGTWAACSGTLISPTVFPTAAHCDLEVSRVAVTFDSPWTPPQRGRSSASTSRFPSDRWTSAPRHP
jgi:V8-like Glu-specific endopeptidase